MSKRLANQDVSRGLRLLRTKFIDLGKIEHIPSSTLTDHESFPKGFSEFR